MTRRFLSWLANACVYLFLGAVLLVLGVILVGLLLHGPRRQTAYDPARASQTALHAFPGVLSEEAALPPAGGANPSASSAAFSDPRMEAGATKADGAGTSPASSFAPSAVSLDLADYALATPALRPLASDCRLPCYGTARVGPASWYNAGPGYYAAIPGYLGGVVSVVVCTFPDGQANCHTFPVRDSCQCFRHTPAEIVVDLSPAAFREFQPDLSRGIVMVQITVLR